MSHATLRPSSEVSLNNNEIVLNKRPVNIRDFLMTFRNHHLYTLELQNISIIMQTIPDLIIAFIDQEKILQVLNQFIENSRSALPEGGDIYLKAYRQSDTVIISLIDNGSGIKEENLKKINLGHTNFIVGKQVKLGVGLFISRWIVQAHGGQISVDSQVGQGSKVSVCLPLYC
ncbi:MAG: cell wall metabolism sensor histidine kinase WalK [Proteobacteria bacterium]|jgi:signal transduction histidine kinase|nr:cell wall metabolism sensor histidine kinase WalK [Pseudomonadota bacterium]